MDIHVCKQCGSHFVYCRACVFRPIRYKDNGFCSKECYEASKNVVVTMAAPEIVEEVAVFEESKQDVEIVDDLQLAQEETPVDVAVDTTIVEVAPVVEPKIKKETSNTYKNKKNKY